VTIPKSLREQLGIKPGQVLEFGEEGGKLIARKVNVQEAAGAVYGVVQLGASTDKAIEALRGVADP